MAEQTQAVANEPQLQQGQEEGVPEKVVEAVVDGDKPNGYKIVRSVTGKSYVEVSLSKSGAAAKLLLRYELRQEQQRASGGASDTVERHHTTYTPLTHLFILQANEYDPLEHHRSVSSKLVTGRATAAGQQH